MIDTATQACSVALCWQGDIYRRWELAPSAHGERILSMIEAVLSEAGTHLKALDGIAFGCGPGSFTGLRVGVGVVQGLAFTSQISVIPISNLAMMAEQARRRLGSGRWLVAMDARMDEVYWGIYGEALRVPTVQLLGAEHVGVPTALPWPEDRGWKGIGTGWQLPALRERGEGVVEHIEPDWLPDAVDGLSLAQIAYQEGRALPAAQAIPTYLRNNVAQVKQP